MRALGTRAVRGTRHWRGAKHSRNASRTSVLREYSRCLGSKVHAPPKCRIAHAYLDRLHQVVVCTLAWQKVRLPLPAQWGKIFYVLSRNLSLPFTSNKDLTGPSHISLVERK